MVDPLFFATRSLIGFVTGVCVGLTGVGGGVLVVPALTVLGLAPAGAVATASIYSVITKAWAAVHHLRRGNVEYRAVGLFLAAGMPAAMGAASVVKMHSTQPWLNAGLGWAVALLVVGAGFYLLLGPTGRRKSPLPVGMTREAMGETRPRRLSMSTMVTATLMGLVSGAVLGATSIGGGIILVPAILFCFPLGTRVAVGSAVVVSLVLVCVSSAVYGSAGSGVSPVLLVDYRSAACMAAGSFVGVWLGANWGAAMSDMALRAWVVAISIASVSVMLWSISP